MHQTTAPKSDKLSFTVTVDPNKVSKGHRPHRGGAGKHGDRRQKRLKTRSARFCAATQE